MGVGAGSRLCPDLCLEKCTNSLYVRADVEAGCRADEAESRAFGPLRRGNVTFSKKVLGKQNLAVTVLSQDSARDFLIGFDRRKRKPKQRLRAIVRGGCLENTCRDKNERKNIAAPKPYQRFRPSPPIGHAKRYLLITWALSPPRWPSWRLLTTVTATAIAIFETDRLTNSPSIVKEAVSRRHLPVAGADSRAPNRLPSAHRLRECKPER
ncbi:hypothetical protein EVAR_85110_1 [Eumeta japonica]|uniref:Uncharacterized protein n=1 Tax=Eumeta variegata TaxID=151549 RepID=A0A4C1XS73_EUMVA|nr:hypothetical protein EVAR_85110_1 [Eumeta japonica]